VSEAGKYMSELMGVMTELKESSDKVGRIVKTIDDIAFQTNLLAINATVEAARAGGDAGRSFAVVAEEVRNLALKSSKEAANTTSIIENNISLTNSGREISDEVSNTLGDLMEKSQQLSQLISEVNTSSEQQAVSIKQINVAIGQMERVTQENAAVAEENYASSDSMKNELINLENAIIQAGSALRDSGNIPAVKSVRPAPVRSESMPPLAAKRPAPSVNRPAASAAKFEPAPQPAKTTANKTKNDAEKIIPLDDNDDF
jgi:methyl-accepting chemotaxis protein